MPYPPPGQWHPGLAKIVSLFTGYKAVQSQERSESAFARTVADTFLDLFWNGQLPPGPDLNACVVVVWRTLSSPTTVIDPAIWREVFATAGPIEHHRKLPTKSTQVFRLAPKQAARGWSWTTDPFELLTMPWSNKIAPQYAFEEIARRLPEHHWYSTVVQPEQVLMTSPAQAEFIIGYVPGGTTDEIVVDPLNLGEIETVSVRVIRERFFTNLYLNDSTQRWQRRT